ncbi:hypothetical protein HYX13_02705 [Candidatus Woesearchaeota archaeon]|nr:hypothetical protein [Candidatus Woesearchaeota archaeon]
MKNDLRMVGLFLVVSFILVSCNPSLSSQIPAEKQCVFDSDCVPAGCCHPADAVNKDFAPDCSETFCTMECAPNTLDCGQGEVKCVDKRCVAVLENVLE